MITPTSYRLIRRGHPLRDHWIDDYQEELQTIVDGGSLPEHGRPVGLKHDPKFPLVVRRDEERSVIKLCPWKTTPVGKGFRVAIYDEQDYLTISNRLGVKMCYEANTRGTRWSQRRRSCFINVLRVA